MFVEAIKRVGAFTRPIHIITRLYKQSEVLPGAASMFFVNENGYAVTCKHVAEIIVNATMGITQQNYNRFRGESHKYLKDSHNTYHIQRLEQQFNLELGTIVTQKVNFINSFSNLSQIDVTYHPKYDLALLHFQSEGPYFYTHYAEFLADNQEYEVGRSLCRLGFPFSEFKNFRYNANIDDIEWTPDAPHVTPAFPIDGILTRFIGDETGYPYALEMSTPGLVGQSGGPLFDKHGIIYGMQQSTRHLHLGFDMINQDVWIGTHRAKVSNHPFLHVGVCISAEIIKDFLRHQKVKFYQRRPE
ncbi:MAG: trypsin-like peptidase domain-containing protein [Runella zeae]